MRVINIIESVGKNNIVSVESFGVFEEQLSQEVIDQAEALFIAKATENGWNDDDYNDIESFIEDGSFHNNDYSVSIVWSDI